MSREKTGVFGACCASATVGTMDTTKPNSHGANPPWAPTWFAPPLPADGKITTQVRFETPGTYVLRALADDGALTGGTNVTVVVTGPSS